MSKNWSATSPGSGTGSLHGDVSFIRATQSTNTTNQNLDKHSHQNVPRMSVDVALQPHLYHHQSRQASQQYLQDQSRQTSQQYLQDQSRQTSQQYLTEHLDSQLKQDHGAGDPARVTTHPGSESWGESLCAELDEAKIRVAQMEKTMRWWSDCTSSWREKWNKARNERNKAREENRILRSKLETLAKELTHWKKKEPTTPVTENHVPHESGSPARLEKAANESGTQSSPARLDKTASQRECESLDDVSEASSMSRATSDQHEHEHDDKDGEGSVSGESTVLSEMSERIVFLQERETQILGDLAQAQNKAAQAQENLILMQRKLDEANNSIQIERLEKCAHMKTIERLEHELKQVHSKLEEDSHSMQEMKLELERNTKLHQEEVTRLNFDLEDETLSRTTMDKQVCELRRELEQIQAENASEWAKRERLESEKLSLERENKKLRTEVKDLEEELEKKGHVTTSLAESDMKTLQFELTDKIKELADAHHLHSKLKKALAERSTELDHHRRRAEQYESEVRSLRGRVDKLKHELAAAEDEVDKHQNSARKAQRTSDELQTQVESLELQVSHLQTRLRRNSKHSVSVGAPRSTSLRSLTMEDSAELADSETDFDDV